MSEAENSGQETKFEPEQNELRQLANQLRVLLDIRTRKHGFPAKEYPNSFVGSDAVEQIIAEGIAMDEADAIRIGNLLLNAGVFHHVHRDHAFKNENLFYRFASDEDHGEVSKMADGKEVSWADFLASPLSDGGHPKSLQADIPDRDPDLAQFAQDDLDAIGIEPLDEHNTTLLDATHPRSWNDPSPKAKYNLVVIGAGTGGLVSAAGAAGLGARVALIESHLLGGDCLNVGCVPSKALISCARTAAAVRNCSEFGVRVDGEVSVDFGAVMERMRRLRAGIAPHDSATRFSSKLGVDVFIGKARFTGPNTVEVNGKSLVFSKAVVATGGTAAIPPIPGLREAPFLTNATIFNLTALPDRLGVIGAGPIGLELAQSFQRFGSDVTVFSRSGAIMPKEDPEAAAIVKASMQNDGVRFEERITFKRVETTGSGTAITVVLEDGDGERELPFDALLVAAGRKPNVNGLGFEEAGIEYDQRTGVTVNDRMQSTNPIVYAVGDVASRYQFTHIADFSARIAIRNALFFGRDKFSGLIIPWATYTEPEVAHVGLYERDLEDRGIAYTTFRKDLAGVDRAILEGETEGFVKVHVKKGGDEILGATIVGPNAGDMISEISVAMHNDMGLGKLASVIHPYPTMAEAIRQCGDEYNRTRLTPTIKKIFNGLMASQR